MRADGPCDNGEHAALCDKPSRTVMDQLALVVSIALVDGLNPTTIVPALYLATGPHAVRSVVAFAGGFLAVNMTAGVVAFALGQRLARLVPRPSQSQLHLAEIVVGLVAVAVAGLLWHRRRSVEDAFGKAEHDVSRAAWLAGGTFAAAELPTALPYFAIVGVLAASRGELAVRVMLLLVFNLLFLAPVFAIAAVRALAGPRAVGWLADIRLLVMRRAGAIVALLVLVLGIALVVVGAAGIITH